MGVFQRYRNNEGKPTGPWFVRYPVKRDMKGKIVYTREMVGEKSAARAFLAQKTAEFNLRERTGTPYASDLSFAQLVDWYLEQSSPKAKCSYNKDVQRSGVLKSHFGHLKCSKIRPSDIDAYQQKRLQETNYKGTPNKPATINRELALIKRMFNLAIRDELVSRNPCKGVPMLAEQNKRDRVLTPDEYRRLLRELPATVRSIVAVAYHTGMRISEILTLTWDKANLKERWIDLGYTDTKTKQMRRIFLSDDILSVLQAANKVRNLSHRVVFTHSDGRPVKSIRKAFENACRRAGITDFVVHDLRHCFVTNMRKAGVHDSVIMTLTGHKTPSMFLRYNSVDELDGREAVQKLSDYLGNMAELSDTKVTHGRNPGSR